MSGGFGRGVFCRVWSFRILASGNVLYPFSIIQRVNALKIVTKSRSERVLFEGFAQGTGTGLQFRDPGVDIRYSQVLE